MHVALIVAGLSPRGSRFRFRPRRLHPPPRPPRVAVLRPRMPTGLRRRRRRARWWRQEQRRWQVLWIASRLCTPFFHVPRLRSDGIVWKWRRETYHYQQWPIRREINWRRSKSEPVASDPPDYSDRTIDSERNIWRRTLRQRLSWYIWRAQRDGSLVSVWLLPDIDGRYLWC